MVALFLKQSGNLPLNFFHIMFRVYRRFKALKSTMAWRDALRLALFELKNPKFEDQILLSSDSLPFYFRRGTSDFDCFEQIFLSHQYRSPLQIAPLTIVDAGANIGASVRYFAHTFPKAQIWAIEPDLTNFELLRRNSKNLPQTHLIASALWPNKEPVFITDLDAEKWKFEVSIAPSISASQALSSLTIPEILSQIPSGRINLLKLDIEGAERELFQENADVWLSKVDVIIIELHDRFKAGCSNAFYAAICKRPFHQEVMGENIFIYFMPENAETVLA